jgi:hypothetical protein
MGDAMNNSISLLDGKYTFIINDQLQVVVLRYGEPWRQFEVGDKAMYSLVTYAIELEEELAKKNREIDSLRETVMQIEEARRQISSRLCPHTYTIITPRA